MWRHLTEKYPRYPYVLGTEWFRAVCELFGLEVFDEIDSPAWRFVSLKEPARQPAIDAVVSDSLARLKSAPKTMRRFAVIAPMPPAETGIANATVQTFSQYDGGVDVFTRFEDAYGYFAFATEQNRRATGLNAYDVSTLPVAMEKHRYDAIVVTLGNSPHNRFAAAQLMAFTVFPPPCPVYVHVHDPWLHDLWAWTALSRGSSAAIELSVVYGGRRQMRFHRRTASDMGALGLSGIIGDAAVAGIIVNSAAAAALVRRDLELARRDSKVIQAFHPVFPPVVPVPLPNRAERPLVIGTFGIPGEAKRTEVIHAACASLVRKGLASELVMAGYGVSAYLDSNRLDRSFVRAVDAPGDATLQALMAQVDVAVQLRRGSLGESSGVVPQLLALERPVVVSEVGSFIELGNAVVQTGATVRARQIEDAILQAASARADLRRQARSYCESHTREQFVKLLESTVEGETLSRGRVRAVSGRDGTASAQT